MYQKGRKFYRFVAKNLKLLSFVFLEKKSSKVSFRDVQKDLIPIFCLTDKNLQTNF